MESKRCAKSPKMAGGKGIGRVLIVKMPCRYCETFYRLPRLKILQNLAMTPPIPRLCEATCRRSNPFINSINQRNAESFTESLESQKNPATKWIY